jgi:hypothetical protein
MGDMVIDAKGMIDLLRVGVGAVEPNLLAVIREITGYDRSVAQGFYGLGALGDLVKAKETAIASIVDLAVKYAFLEGSVSLGFSSAHFRIGKADSLCKEIQLVDAVEFGDIKHSDGIVDDDMGAVAIASALDDGHSVVSHIKSSFDFASLSWYHCPRGRRARLPAPSLLWFRMSCFAMAGSCGIFIYWG